MHKIIFILICLFTSVIGYSQNPTAQFTANKTTACVGEEITFTSTSTAGGSPIVSWNWFFGNGDVASGSVVKYSFSAPGSYTIRLSVTDLAGNADPDAEIKTNFITINPNPNAQFLINANNCTLPVAASFINQSQTGSNITYDWKFGNSQTSTAFTPPSVNYPTAGNYTIDLTVTNTTTKCISKVSKTISASNFAADFTGPDSICIGSTANFIDNSSLGVNSWQWTFGNVGGSAAQNSSHTFNVARTYSISLTSQNTISGCSSTKTKQLVVVALPKPTFTSDKTSGCIDLDVQFTNTTNGGSNFIWNFGDGTTFSGKTPPLHTYTTNGFFTVKLTATGKNGCVKDTIRTAYIHTAPPDAGFVTDKVDGCTDLDVNFFDLSSSPGTDPIISWAWDFGDGGTSTLQHPSHTFTTGKYTIQLKIITQLGCEKTFTTIPDYIKVGKIDDVDFTHTPTTICAKNQQVTFTNQTVISKPHLPSEVIYKWEFGDPNGQGKSGLKDPTYNYPLDTGYMKVKLTVVFRGCELSKEIESAVFVNPPIAKFDASKVCNPVNFPANPVNVPTTDQSIIGRKGDDIKMTWKWGDPLNTETTIIDHSYDNSTFSGNSSFNYLDYGTYTILQEIHNYTTGCTDITPKTITISKIDPDFTLSASEICKNGTVVMTGNSTPTPAIGFPITRYDYNMGEGGSTSGNGIPTASYKYTTSNTYNITMTATNSVGCTASKVLSILVHELPVADISYTDNICGPVNVTFTNASTKIGNGFPTFSSFEWIMPRGSGSQITNSINTPTQFNFNAAGNFKDSIKLIATDGFGCVSDTVTKYINMSLPNPAFTIPSVICNNTPVTPINTTPGNNNTFEWFIDNGLTPTTSIIFNDSQNEPLNKKDHTVKLVVTDIHNCKNNITQPITVSLPKANFTQIFKGAALNSDHIFSCPPVIADLTDHSTYYGQTIGLKWDFGNGITSTLQGNAGDIYIFAGTYTGSLKITDQYGCTDDTIKVDYLTIGGPSVKVNYYSTGTICDNLYHFDTLNAKSVDHLSWNFGDSQSAVTAPIEHDYPYAGTYTPILTVYDKNNCTVEYPMTAFSVPNEIHAKYTTTPTIGKTEEAVVFDDQSLFNAPIVSWYWKFGDFDSTTQLNNTDANVSFTYNFPYTYPTSLTVVDANGCTDTYKLPLNVKGDFAIANVFTPNGDGLNDTFKFFHDLFQTYDITIVNRWDNLIYEKKNAKGIAIWDGTDQNKELCNEGVYFFIIKGTLLDGSAFEKVGFVTLI